MGDFRRQADIATRHARSTDDALLEGLRHEKAALHGARRGLAIGLIAGGIVLAAGVWLFVAFRPSNAGDPNACMREHAGFIDIKPSCAAPVSIERDGDVILAHPGVSLEERGSGWRVRHGTASFAARARTDGNALRVLVSHGVIAITGTRFTVVQEEGKGRVKVDEGTVVFHDDDGTDVPLTAGSELTWPRPPTAEVVVLNAIPLTGPKPPAARAGVPRGAVARANEAAAADEEEEDEEEVEEEEAPPTGVLSMEDILKRISTLRRQKRPREAVELLLSQSQRGDITPAQMARLSWEIGLFLQDSGERAATCNHWKNHARKYPDDAAHSDRVRELIKTCETSQ
ncbi:MAG: FecR domain-containing protein [Myxococcota bacterium]|nr:FecR domain-containing protein [Myxococcota bacterium]